MTRPADPLRFLAQHLLSNTDQGAGEPQRLLAAGGWTLVDHFDADGHRYLIVRREGGSAALDPEEQLLLRRRAQGDALKEIAIDLGVSISAVSRRLAAAMRKLGIRSHTDLPRLLPALAGL
jgi:DNA-binding NarL/FixJ family response regulator